MKKILLIAAVALIAVSCNKTEITTPATKGRTITVTATLPTDEPQSRISLEYDGKIPNGLQLKWEKEDKLQLCFVHSGKYYYSTAPIIAEKISSDSKKAEFSITLPENMPKEGTFTFHAVYQKTDGDDSNGGRFEPNTENYLLEWYEERAITLDDPKGMIHPMLRFSQKEATATTLKNISLEHTGWVMAVNFKNETTSVIELPEYLQLFYEKQHETSFIWNGYQRTDDIKVNINNVEVSRETQQWTNKASIYFNINREGLPLYNKEKLEPKEIRILYRWIVSTPDIQPMKGKIQMRDKKTAETSTPLKARKVENGKVYHVKLSWDGNQLQWGKLF